MPAPNLTPPYQIGTGQLPVSVVLMDSGAAPTVDHTTALVDGNDWYYDSASGKVKGRAASGAVSSVFGRTGAVTAQAGDYTPVQVGAVSRSITSIAYSATITPALPSSGTAGGDLICKIGTLTGNLTVANPTGTPADGQRFEFKFVIDATGGRSITWDTHYVFTSDVAQSLIPTAANSKFRVVWEYDADDSVFYAVAINRH